MNNYTLIIIAMITLFMTSCKNEPETASEVIEETTSIEDGLVRITKKQFDSSGYELGTPEKVAFEKIIPVSGTIHVPEKNRAKVSTLVNGTVGDISLIDGQWVNKNQVLFTVTNPDLINMQENYLLASEELNYKISEQKRLEQLLAEKLTTRNELTKVNFEISHLKTKIAALRTRIELLGLNADDLSNENLRSTISITAPMSGFLSDITAIKGLYLETAQSGMNITNTAHKHLELQVLERDISKISKGQKIAFYLQEDPNTTYSAEVYLIDKMVDESHMIKVHCHIEKENAKSLIPGMYISANIVTQNNILSALPNEAIVQIDGMANVLQLKSQTDTEYLFEKIEVQTGQINESHTELKNVANMNNKYLTKGAYFIIM